jgi:phenylacetate-CoA ligase
VLEVRREGVLDRLDVLVEVDPQAADSAGARDEAAPELQRRIKAYVGVSASVTVCEAGTLERSVGKARRVIDRRREPIG